MVMRSCQHCSTKNRSKARFCHQCGQLFPKEVEIFFSYAHEDETLKNALLTHLSLLKREDIVKTWHDRDINAGTDWSSSIDQHLQTAEIILLLVSADFMASDYCYSIEMAHALKRGTQDETVVIPIILRPTDWKSAPFGGIQALPTGFKPIVQWPNRDQAWLDTVKGIRQAIRANY